MQKTWVFDLGVIIVLWQQYGATIGQKIYLLKPFAPVLFLRLAQTSFSHGRWIRCYTTLLLAKLVQLDGHAALV